MLARTLFEAEKRGITKAAALKSLDTVCCSVMPAFVFTHALTDLRAYRSAVEGTKRY